MDSSVGKLSARKEAALRALLNHKTLEHAAESCNVNVRTLRRWMRNREFLARYRQEQDALLSSTVDLLRAESASAVATLAAIAKDANTPPGASVRVQACKALLDFGFKGIEIHALTERVSELERHQNEKQHEGRS
jgi:hypothetical protein